jgi:hypothetical protein
MTWVAIGCVKFVTEDEGREVKDSVLDHVFHVTGETKADLFSAMATKELESRRLADAALIRGEMEDQPEVEYPLVNWHGVVQTTDHLTVTDALQGMHATPEWHEYKRTGPASALEQAIQEMCDEIDQKNTLLNMLHGQRRKLGVTSFKM